MPLKDPKARAEYNKVYAAKNRVKAYERLKEWRKQNPDKVAAQNKRYAERYPKKVNLKALKSKWKNIDKVREKNRLIAAKFRKNNSELIKQRKQQYQRTHQGVINASIAKRRAAKFLRTPKWVGPEEMWLIEQIYELAALRTKMFGAAWHVDHIIPLQGNNVSGLHVPTNLQVIPGKENIRKSNSFVVA